MLTPNVRVEGWSVSSWERFLGLFRPDRAQLASNAGLIVVQDEGRVRKAVHTEHGALHSVREIPSDLAVLARDTHASWVMILSADTLAEGLHRFGERVTESDSAIAHLLLGFRIIRELVVEGSLRVWPSKLSDLPIPTEPMVERALDACCAHGHCMVLGMFDKGELWTAACLRRGVGGFDVIAGPEELVLRMGLLSGDFRRDYAHLVQAVESTYGPLSLGCFAELEPFRRLQRDRSPGAWSSAIALREVILSPIPAGIGVALGVDSLRLAASRVSDFANRIPLFSQLAGQFKPSISSAFASATGTKRIEEALGFHPLEMIRRLIEDS